MVGDSDMDAPIEGGAVSGIDVDDCGGSDAHNNMYMDIGQYIFRIS